MSAGRDGAHRRRAVAAPNVVDGMLQGGGAGQRGSGTVDENERLGIGVPLLSICPAAPLPVPQLQLCFLFHYPIERKRDSAYCETLGIRQDKCAASGIA